MSFALRVVALAVALGAVALFLYIYRRQTNKIVVIVVVSYAIAAAARLVSLPTDEEVVRNAVAALFGLAVVWAAALFGARWLERKGWPGSD